jgi:hypothetical protein
LTVRAKLSLVKQASRRPAAAFARFDRAAVAPPE